MEECFALVEITWSLQIFLPRLEPLVAGGTAAGQPATILRTDLQSLGSPLPRPGAGMPWHQGQSGLHLSHRATWGKLLKVSLHLNGPISKVGIKMAFAP